MPRIPGIDITTIERAACGCSEDDTTSWCFVCSRATCHFGEHSDEQLRSWWQRTHACSLSVHELDPNPVYVGPRDRFIVSLVVGYGDHNSPVTTALDAASAALALTQDAGSSGTQWYVYDRQTRTGQVFEQSQLDPENVP